MTTCIGLGSDLLRIDRIARMGTRNGTMLLDRLLAPAERVALGGYGDDAADWPGCAGHVAGLVASKEAFFKAIGTGLVQPLRWSDVAVTTARHAAHDQAGGKQVAGSAMAAVSTPSPQRHDPTITLAGAAAAAFAALGGIACRLTLCGDRLFVLATVFLLGRSPSLIQHHRLTLGDEHA